METIEQEKMVIRKKKVVIQDENENPEILLKKDFEMKDCNNSDNMYSKECNKFLLRKEYLEREELREHPDENDYLYPNLNDPLFNVKIAEKTEFYENQYDGNIHKDIKEHAEMLSKADFELAPHQAFVRNFLSFQTPYNSLLLYHYCTFNIILQQLHIYNSCLMYVSPRCQHLNVCIVTS